MVMTTFFAVDSLSNDKFIYLGMKGTSVIEVLFWQMVHITTAAIQCTNADLRTLGKEFEMVNTLDSLLE